MGRLWQVDGTIEAFLWTEDDELPSASDQNRALHNVVSNGVRFELGRCTPVDSTKGLDEDLVASCPDLGGDGRSVGELLR